MILETVQRAAASQLIYAASHVEAAGARYDIFTRVYYTDDARTTYFAVTGYLVNLDTVRQNLLSVLVERGLGKRLDPADGTPAFEMRVLDEQGQLVFGPSGPASRPSAEAQLELQFYPEDDIRTRMAAKAPKRTWTIIVSQRNGQSPVLVGSMRPQTYWLSALSVLLIGAALGFALQARGRAAQLSRMQTDFVAHVSHQLKTPVSLLSAVTETVDLVRGRAPEKLDQCLDIIKVETARLSSLVQHILEFSSISEGRRLELEPVALASLVRETAESFAAALAPTGFHIEVHERGAPTVAADPVALEQALVNLLDNAVKYSGESRQIEVRVRSEATDACIEVIDRGIGVDPRDQARIFERFYRGSHGAANRQGFGLGLAIARLLVEGQRGIIELKSEPGVGSTFTIRLPLLRPESAIEARVEIARSFSKRTAAGISDVGAGKEPA
jgi:signal transduction histidine kinase